MSAETFLNGRVTLHAGDSRDVLKTIADNSIDSIVTDPPYALVSIVKRVGKPGSAPIQHGTDGAFARVTKGFMGKEWDTGESAFDPNFWTECLRVLKPGGHVMAFSGTRTVHRMVCAIEDAGFEIRDSLQWLYGSGFPKSHDVSKGIDKAAGAKRKIVGRRPDWVASASWRKTEGRSDRLPDSSLDITSPATDSAREWEGWGTALKPAVEPICLARKPLDRGNTVAANVLQHGTGAINIDGCRVETSENLNGGAYAESGGRAKLSGDERDGAAAGMFQAGKTAEREYVQPAGRWPANVVHDGSDEVVGAFPDAPGQQFYVGPEHGDRPSKGIYGDFGARPPNEPRGDSGSAARFFYTAKADADDRLGSKHPTVKPVDLMQWLCRLVTPKGGTVLDPFAGTGTTGAAAFREGFSAVLIEREPEYQADIRRRMALCMSGPEERKRESIKAKLGNVPFEDGSLFAGIEAAGQPSFIEGEAK